MKLYCAVIYNNDEKYFLTLGKAKEYILSNTNNLKLNWSSFGNSWNYGTVAKITEFEVEE